MSALKREYIDLIRAMAMLADIPNAILLVELPAAVHVMP
jgi:hypothetical protein